MKSFLNTIAAMALCGALVAAPARAQDGVSAGTVLATVNGVDITVGHLLVAHQGLPAQFRALPPETLFTPLLEQLIEQTALMQAGADALSLRDQIVLENDRRATIAGAALNRVAEQAVSDTTLAVAYDAFVAAFEAEEPTPEFNASHIIVQTEAEAQALREQLDAGADFADLAREHSTDGAAAGGGLLGWFGPGVMIPEFENAVSAMQPGDIAGPLETRFGWHLVRLNETRISSVPGLDEIREELADQIRREAADAEIARVIGAAGITRSHDGVSPQVLGRPELLAD